MQRSRGSHRKRWTGAAGFAFSQSLACALGSAIFLLVVGLSFAPARAVVTDTGDGTGNNSNPPDDPGWDAVGRAGSLTGVYVGNGWVLTAHHVVAGGEPQFTLGGVTYQPVPGSEVQFDTDGSNADLAVYRIFGRPNAPEILLSDAPPVANVDDVTMIGKGWTREASATTWTAAWSETPPGVTAYTGYKRLSSGVMRWGRNRVTKIGVDLTLGSRVTRSFYAAFDAAGGLADEGQAVSGDSGGAVFVKRGGVWELIGIMYARTEILDQPNLTAVFGNETIAADLSYYRDQILVATAPEIPLLPAHGFGILVAAIVATGCAALGRRKATGGSAARP